MNIYQIVRDCKHCGSIKTVMYICRNYSDSGMYCIKCEKKEG